MTDQAAPSATSADRPIVVFDIDETLLDFTVLSHVFGAADMLRTWFNQVILYSEALTLSGLYVDSGTVGVAVLKMLAESKGRRVERADIEALKRLSGAMPTYADTPKALADLQEAGFRLVTFSNNPSAGVDAQLTHAGIRGYFSELHSIDDQVHRYKPARESYNALATTLGVAPSDLWLVSCHAFDTLGAAAAGYRTALVLRPENAPVALGRTPDIVTDDLGSITRRIVLASARRN
ncbi:haloacid dehalogenase type II [Methylobacterium sp. J-068]|uniref:haloacid dehalogenase type II n=1 Tax=Methylobacterium sp. J-068 TaxID=2836649 RepID=UPI001FB88AC8|nr:haloacid dehalogenase type II [Methylobacterium sp. J-068]MCJ2032863.1 haloacid dehalogenase type II [Methylobacterium sp. J-068]